jgi:hypothetical protein
VSAAVVSAAKSVRDLSRALGRRGGAAQPDGFASKIDPSLIPRLAAGLGCGCALVTGTQGQTTTTRTMADADSPGRQFGPWRRARAGEHGDRHV